MNKVLEKIDEMSTEKLLTVVLASCFCFLTLSITTCSVHMNMYNPGDAKADAMKQQGVIDLSKQKYVEEMERIKAVEKLIKDSGVDPIAARCAVEGWKGSNTMASVCKEVVTNPTTTEAPE